MKGKKVPAQCNSHDRWKQYKTSISFNLLPAIDSTTSFNLLLTIIIAILNLSNKKLSLWRKNKNKKIINPKGLIQLALVSPGIWVSSQV